MVVVKAQAWSGKIKSSQEPGYDVTVSLWRVWVISTSAGLDRFAWLWENF